jgi:hypothetical protein
MTDPARKRPRVLLGIFLAAVMVAVLVPRSEGDPGRAWQNAVATALAADDRLLQVALEQYPEQAPAIAITYGHLELFREQLARFGPQVIPIVAAYQTSFTTADALQVAGQALQSVTRRFGGSGLDQAPLTTAERGLIALLKMQGEGNAFVGQWEITAAGDAKRVPSRLVTLAGPELLVGGLTALERGLVQEREIDWQTYGLAAVDLAAIASGVAVLRFASRAARGAGATRAAGTVTPRFGALAAAEVLGANAIRFGVPVGLVALLVMHPGVFTHYLWLLAEGLGMPGILGPIIGWSMVVAPLAFLLSWVLLSARALGLAGWVLAGTARGCRHLAVRLAVDRPRSA